MNSILTSVKKLLGLDEAYTEFDADVIMHINSVFAALVQMGVVFDNGATIYDSDTTWSDKLSAYSNLESIKTYVALKVRLLFDPPASGTILESFNNQLAELEWRIHLEVDP